MRNLAIEFLNSRDQTPDDWYMDCSSLCDELVEGDDSVVYVDGDVDREHEWQYHQVMMRNGLVHDAWHPNEIEATPLSQWLIDMFGLTAYVTVCIDGEDVFEGECKNFQWERLAKAA